MPATSFARRRVPWAVGVAAAFALAAMLVYPGGTPLDPSARLYSLTQNFLSDLGMTVAYNGHPNVLGAGLFVVSLVVLIAGLGECLFEFVRVVAASPRSRA